MEKIARDSFRKLEKLNAQIDIWIDEEEYKQVEDNFGYDPELDICFKNTHCTHQDAIDTKWQVILNTEAAEPVTLFNVNAVSGEWSKLFYAKLLRAKIQKSGTDCYFSRLDQVVDYLEKHIPNPYNDPGNAKLAVLYLLELSADSLTYEMMGFAERARRLLRENKYLKDDKPFSWFYGLLARYNNGVSHFHLSNYRKALLEFNEIIFEIKKTANKEHVEKDRIEKLEYYKELDGGKLLYLPAVIYRADIQLKLQLAYHAFKTLDANFFKGPKYEYKRYKARLIKIQAYQFMGEFKKASTELKRLWDDLYKKKQEFPFLNDSAEMKNYVAFSVDILTPESKQNIRSRLVSLAIDQHIDCLKGQKGLLKIKRDEKLKYLKGFGEKSLLSCFKVVEFEEPDRTGYLEQVADYLGWLADSVSESEKSTNVRLCDEDITESEIAGITKFCNMPIGKDATHTLINHLLEKSPYEPGDDTAQPKDKNGNRACLFCDPKGIELSRLHSNHYDDFRDRMLKVLKKQRKLKIELESHQYEKFIERLLTVEEQDRNNLRINDLNLRYKSDDVITDLEKDLKKNKASCWPRSSGNCPDKQIMEMIEEFELLPCDLPKEKFAKLQKPAEQNDEKSFTAINRYTQVMEQWNKHFLRHLESPSVHEKQDPGFYFLGLQRWNSSSPAEGYSLGGGYLLYDLNEKNEVSYGIAIDPGFDFVRNLFHMGFSLNDIDVIIISHAHIDHIRDFESIVTLLLELEKRTKTYRKIHVILTLGVYKRLKFIMENPKLRLHIEPYIIDVDREVETNYFENLSAEKYSFRFKRSNKSDKSDDGINRLKPVLPSKRDDYLVRVCPTRAYHDDYSDYSDSFGFLIDVRLDGKSEKVTIGYTGDTKWIYPKIKDPIKDKRDNKDEREITDIVKQYESCDALIVHMGSLIDNKNGYEFLKYNQCSAVCKQGEIPCEALVREKGHPYLIGLLRILSSVYGQFEKRKGIKPLVLVSEFGEELRGKIRVDLIKRLVKVYGDRMYLLPVDIGINVQLITEGKQEKSNNCSPEKKILCVQCNRFVSIGEADFEHYGQDEAIFCLCKTCRDGTPSDVLQSHLRQLYDVGYELHSAKKSK